jgi:hypothetical protein
MPPFTEQGYLPPGIWPMTWQEFCDRYGYNTRRINLLSGLLSALRLLIPLGCHTVYIGGSFVTSKEKPNDVDGCFDAMNINNSLIDPIFKDLDAQKARFGCELRMDFMSGFQGYLQSGRGSQPLGIIEIDLNSLTLIGKQS